MRAIDADALKESIKKQLAIAKMVGELSGDDDDDKELMDLICNFFETAAMQEIDNAPTIEPERKVGKWVDYSDDGYVECPFCGSATNCDGNINELHYCFSCGAKMEV